MHRPSVNQPLTPVLYEVFYGPSRGRAEPSRTAPRPRGPPYSLGGGVSAAGGGAVFVPRLITIYPTRGRTYTRHTDRQTDGGPESEVDGGWA